MSKNEFAFLSKALMCHSGRTKSSHFIAELERENGPTMGGIVKQLAVVPHLALMRVLVWLDHSELLCFKK